MKQFFTLFLVVTFVFTSCEKNDNDPQAAEVADQTVLMYLPWSGDSKALTSYFIQNIADFKTAIGEGILNKERVLVFFSSTSTKASLFEIKYSKGKVMVDTLQYYTNPAITTQEGITSILNDVKEFAPAERYSMIIGCHGLGWLPVSSGFSRSMGLTPHWEGEGVLTRYFGGTSSQYQTDITTLADAITAANMSMDYILFDDCYMSTIEVAYDLKDVTKYIIACPTEIMAEGMPYAKIGKYLIGDVNPKKICEEFYSFYSTRSYPYGTIGVADCTQIKALVPIMKEINTRYTFNSSNVSA
ncbi:Clostripain family, partial [Popillia japonica]